MSNTTKNLRAEIYGTKRMSNKLALSILNTIRNDFEPRIVELEIERRHKTAELLRSFMTDETKDMLKKYREFFRHSTYAPIAPQTTNQLLAWRGFVVEDSLATDLGIQEKIDTFRNTIDEFRSMGQVRDLLHVLVTDLSRYPIMPEQDPKIGRIRQGFNVAGKIKTRILKEYMVSDNINKRRSLLGYAGNESRYDRESPWNYTAEEADEDDIYMFFEPSLFESMRLPAAHNAICVTKSNMCSEIKALIDLQLEYFDKFTGIANEMNQILSTTKVILEAYSTIKKMLTEHPEIEKLFPKEFVQDAERAFNSVKRSKEVSVDIKKYPTPSALMIGVANFISGIEETTNVK